MRFSEPIRKEDRIRDDAGAVGLDVSARTAAEIMASLEPFVREGASLLVTLEELSAAQSLVDRFAQRFLIDAVAFPHVAANGDVRVAVAEPPAASLSRAIDQVLGEEARFVLAARADILALVASNAAPVAGSETPAPVEDVASLRDLASGAPVVRALDDMLQEALEQRATDLHIEPMRDGLHVRLRVDGVLRAIKSPPSQMAAALVSRIKILSGLDIAERRLPQDGGARLQIAGQRIDVRVATMPASHGEAAVVRFLPRDRGLLDLTRIGLVGSDRTRFENALANPSGLVVITGPTGSGKTTTLACALTLLNDDSRKILTVEDPVEYEIDGIVQTQVNASAVLGFAEALRSFLRHDPDVVMIGEVRDGETARIAVQAALTGHLVLTTLHTESAAAAVPRLVELGVEPFLLRSTLRAVMGQRLVRRLCESCRSEHVLDRAATDRDPRLERLGLAPGMRICEPVGCERCGRSGYRGRVGVFEVLDVGPAVRRAMREGADAEMVENLARTEGFRSLLDHAGDLCRAGETSVREAMRVVGV